MAPGCSRWPFEDTRRKAKKYRAMGSTTRATKRARDRRVHSAAGGVGNLNGNVWTGNVVNAQDPCIPAQQGTG